MQTMNGRDFLLKAKLYFIFSAPRYWKEICIPRQWFVYYKKLRELYNAKIRAESIPNEVSIFYFTLIISKDLQAGPFYTKNQTNL